MLRAAAASLLLIAVSPGAAWAAGALATTAPTSEPAAGETTTDRSDPWERQNRRFYRFNESLDRRLIRPAAKGYAKSSSSGFRDHLRNVLNNLGEPVTAVNDLMQFRVKAAATTAIRFTANSTLGVAGIFDFAGKTGLPGHTNGFANTLGRYGMGPGPYLYMPLLGPSTVRDGVGAGVDALMNPLTLARYTGRVTVATSAAVAKGVDTRAQVDDQLQALNDTATDPYATLRSVYLQNRQAEIKGEIGGKEPLPEFDDPAPVKPQGGQTGSTAAALTAHITPLSQALTPAN